MQQNTCVMHMILTIDYDVIDFNKVLCKWHSMVHLFYLLPLWSCVLQHEVLLCNIIS